MCIIQSEIDDRREIIFIYLMSLEQMKFYWFTALCKTMNFAIYKGITYSTLRVRGYDDDDKLNERHDCSKDISMYGKR